MTTEGNFLYDPNQNNLCQAFAKKAKVNKKSETSLSYVSEKMSTRSIVD